jgi:hypothetical protein
MGIFHGGFEMEEEEAFQAYMTRVGLIDVLAC